MTSQRKLKRRWQERLRCMRDEYQEAFNRRKSFFHNMEARAAADRRMATLDRKLAAMGMTADAVDGRIVMKALQ